MGYYVRIIKSTAFVPAENLDRVYDIMCSLNETHDHEKHGGSWGGTKRTEKRFSWMDENYPETCKDAQTIFNQLGFETTYDDVGNLHLVAYDNNMGQEDLFLKSISTNVIGKIDWIGEDGETWSTVFMGDTVIDSEPTMKLLS